MVATVVKKKRWRRILGALLALACPGVAGAHPEVSPQLVNRYVSVIVLGDRLEYFVTLLYGAVPAADARKRMDTSGDGKIGPDELETAGRGWKARAAELATISIDGQDLPLEGATAGVQLGADESTGAAPVVVEIYGSRPLAAGTRKIRLDARWEPPHLGETELSIDLSPDWELVASHEGHGPPGVARLFRQEGRRPSASADRSATFTVRSAPAVPRTRTLTFFAAAVAALAAVGLVLEVRRRRRLPR